MLAGEEGVNIQMNFPRKDIKIYFKILKNLFNTTSSLLESANALGGNKSLLSELLKGVLQIFIHFFLLFI